MAATGKVIGTVTAVVGEAKATAADGTVRILQVGDQVRSDEAISTSAAGSINVALESGKSLDCGGDVSLTLHESILGVATAASSSAGAPASDVDAIKRAIAAGQDPSQIAAATAAGGAPAAGGADDGGAHEPVILEQGNSATVVSAGFTTEGDTISFPTGQVQAQLMVASVSLPSSAQNDVPAAQSVEVPSAPSFNAPADDQPIVSAVTVELAQGPATPAIEVASTPASESNNTPQIIVSSQAETPVEQNPTVEESSVPVASAPDEAPVEQNPAVEESSAPVAPSPDPIVASEDAPAQEPVIVVADPSTDEDTGDSEQPVVAVTQPEENPADTSDDGDTPTIPVVDSDPEEQSDESPQPPVVVAQPEDETVPVTEPEDDTVVVTAPEDTSDLPDSTSSSSALLTYSISANTNQDEQLAVLTFENGGNAFQSLVFFHQQGQQKPMAVPLEFDLDYGVESTIKLQYIDAFAGDSDSSTGHTAQKIAIKDFALGEGDTNTLIAQESDGVNVGLVGNSMQAEGTVVVKMNDPSTTADDAAAGPVGDWSYTNPVDVNDRVTYDGNPANSPQSDTNGGFDILDVTSSALDLGNLADSELENFEVIALKGSAAQSLTLSVEDVLKVTDGSDVLHIIGGTETARGNTVHDTLNVEGSGWTVVDGDSSAAGIQPSYFGWVQVTHSTGATLLVDPDVNVHLLG